MSETTPPTAGELQRFEIHKKLTAAHQLVSQAYAEMMVHEVGESEEMAMRRMFNAGMVGVVKGILAEYRIAGASVLVNVTAVKQCPKEN